jgi:hypothetical protein
VKLYFEPPFVLVAWCLTKHRDNFAFAVNFTFVAFDMLPFSERKVCMLRNGVLDSARKQYFILGSKELHLILDLNYNSIH